MAKGPKVLSIDIKILEDIRNKAKKYSFNFSEWVESAYFEEFMSINSRQKEIEELNKQILLTQKKIVNIKNKIKLTKKYENIARKILNSTEKRFLSNVPAMIKTGSTWDGLCETFNRLNGKDFGLIEFKRIVEVLDARQKK